MHIVQQYELDCGKSVVKKLFRKFQRLTQFMQEFKSSVEKDGAVV